jgi:hypothetical protein
VRKADAQAVIARPFVTRASAHCAIRSRLLLDDPTLVSGLVIVRRVGWGLILVSIPVVLLSHHGLHRFAHMIVPVVEVGFPVGLVIGLAIRYSVPLKRRMAMMHRLNPRLARRFLPPPDDQAE